MVVESNIKVKYEITCYLRTTSLSQYLCHQALIKSSFEGIKLQKKIFASKLLMPTNPQPQSCILEAKKFILASLLISWYNLINNFKA